MFPFGTVDVPDSSPNIVVLDVWADSGGTSDSGDMGSFTCSAGTNRMLILVQHLTGAVNLVPNINYGGQTMTHRVIGSSGGFLTSTRILTLNEAGIAAATDSDFDEIEFVANSYRGTAICLENVHQSNPIVATGTGLSPGNEIGAASVTLTTEDGGYAVAGVMNDYTTDDAISWALPFIEGIQGTTGSFNYASAGVGTDGTNVTSDITIGETTGTQSAQAAISLRKA